MKTLAVGLDGARKGWVAAILRGDSIDRPEGCETELRLLARIDEVEALQDAGDAAPIAIDIPIGLPPGTRLRACDVEARSRLGKRWSSVFAAPGRDVLELATYAEVRAAVAVAKEKRADAQGLSAQSWGLVPKIREVDAWVRSDAARREATVECHPELTFLALNDGVGPAPKRTAAGALERLSLVNRLFPDADAALRGFDQPGADLSDALDAFAALSSSVRHRRRESEELGDGKSDRYGLPMRMVI